MTHRYLIGIGNETMTDDGIGPRVAQAVSNQARELGFDTIVIGHDAIGILAYFDEATERILFVDCARMGKTPGEWTCFSPEDVESRKSLDRLTTHEGDLLRIVEMARQLDCPIPPITILAIEPERIEPGLELSPALRARFDEYVAAALAEMSRAKRP
jgi:hydrogenase maturation protease